MNALKIYKSSAGSGKTFVLVLEYLKLVLKSPDDYKSILAITFTNKAAAEMKRRIIGALVALSGGEKNPIRTILEDDFPDMDLNLQATQALKNILHDYSSFSVSTIDSFFQRILRALAREINLPLNMQLQIELDDAVLDVTDRLMKDLGNDPELTDWLTELAIQKMDDEKGWHLENDIESVAWEIFNEERHDTRIRSREEIQVQHKKLKTIKHGFEKRMKELGGETLQAIQKYGLSVSDFSYASSGVAGYFEKICSNSKSDNYEPSKRVLDALDDPGKWSTKSSLQRNEITSLAESMLIPKLREILDFREKEFKTYLTASEILKKIYLFGLVNDLQKKFSEFRNEENVILIADTTRLLSEVINESDTPFLYEKTGNRYKHLLIDEFQDTSALQWKNLLPLIVNSLGSGFTTLVVGDAKQSIYRWRGGNMNLLLRNIFIDLRNFKSLLKEEVLSTNYRSRKEVINFNNKFFSILPSVVSAEKNLSDFPLLNLAYDTTLVQAIFPKNNYGGYVRIRFLENIKGDEKENSGWKEFAKKEMLEGINNLLGKGYQFKDICILVTKNKEGNEIANWLFDNGIREIISPDSLLITASPKINFLISVFQFLSDDSNDIARNEIIYYYRSSILNDDCGDYHDIFSDHKRKGSKSRKKSHAEVLFEGLEENSFNKLLPESFTSHLSYFRKLPVYELCEQLIRIFGLNSNPDSYIQRFQDLVLEYSVKNNSSLEGFLKWWDESNTVKNASVLTPENINALRIMTVHKSKGLQFPVVMIPYCEWTLNLKSNEIIWLSAKDSPFEDLGTVVLNSGSKLLDTFFQHEYAEEEKQAIIDNLNLLYVAFTRAEEKLFVSCPPDNGKELNSISKLIFRTWRKLDLKFNGSTVEQGTNDNRDKEEGKKTIIDTESMKSYPINRWQDKISLTTRSGDLLSMMSDRKLTKINYGILVHTVLASINNSDDINFVIDKIVFDGLLGSTEREQLKKEINEVLFVPEIKKYFDESFSVLAERELILPEGEVLRPDRVIVKNNRATVIDFKTGRRDKSHHDQVRKYADVLRRMKYDEVEGVIIYLAEGKVEII